MKKLDKKLNTKISKEDLEVWDNFIRETKSVEDKDLKLLYDRNLKNSKIFDLRLDLHGYTLSESFKKINDLFEFIKDKNIKKILIITGKGLHSNKDSDPYSSKDLSLLRYAVPDYIHKNFLYKIVSIDKSPNYLGGEGSFIINVKKN